MFHFRAKIFISLLFISATGYSGGAYVQIKNIYTNLCLDVRYASTNPGAIIQQSYCKKTGLENQIFYTYAHHDGSYIFKNKRSQLCIEVKDSSRENGATIHQAPCTHAINQNFTLLSLYNGGHALVSQLDGACLHIPKAEKTDGIPVRKNFCRTNNEQNFKIQVISGDLGLVKIPNENVITPVSGPSLPSKLKGVNITGAESGNYTDKNRYGYDYAYPKTSTIDYFVARGFTTIRLPFKGGRLQPKVGGPLDLAELARMDKVVQYARTKGMYVILDPHDYGKMRGPNNVGLVIGTAEMPARHFANFWARLAKVYSKQPNIIFNLMNEPVSQKATQWQASAITALNAIRTVGANQLVLIPGTNWTGAHSWANPGGNGDAWAGFREKNYMFDVHQYLDSDSSGTHVACKAGAGLARLVAFRNWAMKNAKRGYIGEMGWSTDATCKKESQDMMNYITTNSAVYPGWTYFGAGWYNGFMTLNPLNPGQTNQSDQPQLQLLLNNL